MLNQKGKNVKAEKVSLRSPWQVFYRELEALFANDPEVTVKMDNDAPEVRLYVDNPDKADALSQLLPQEKTFGTVTCKVTVVPGNDEVSVEQLYRRAFEGNGSFSYTASIPGGTLYTNPITYVVFKKEVVQYSNDDLGDVNGLCSTLNQEIAKDVFEHREDVHFCTDKG